MKKKPLLARTPDLKQWHLEHEAKWNTTFCGRRGIREQNMWGLMSHLAEDLDSLNLCQKCRDAWDEYDFDEEDELWGVANEHMAAIMATTRRPVSAPVDSFSDWLEMEEAS